MKTLKKIKREKRKWIARFLLFVFITGCAQPSSAYPPTPEPPLPPDGKSIKLALLLDTSNSMDGLIDQAKSQLWRIVNELADAKCEGQEPELRIALYEYGNDGLPSSEGFIRMVTPLTDDLDKISEDLFALRTNGGSEFCGHVIKTSLDQLAWGEGAEDLKLIFIAGNEPFTQGSVNYNSACGEATRKGVTINTIFCGNFQEGISTSWKNGADITGGYYMSIEQNKKTVYIDSPYDDDITKLNKELNETYVPYGVKGASKKRSQVAQDKNAASYGAANSVERIVSKSKKHVYKSKSWDLVDAAEEADFEIAEVEEEHLPTEMQTMTVEERKVYVATKSKERDAIQKKIADLNKERTKYIAQKKAEMGEQEGALDVAMINAIHEQAKAKNFSFGK